MLRRVTIFLTTLTCMVAFLSACKKDEPEPLQAEVRGKLLAGEPGQSKSWKLSNATGNINSGTNQVLTFDACFLDNIYQFTNNSSQTYQCTEGASKCTSTDPDIVESGNWAFALDGSMVIILSNEATPNGLFSYYSLPFPAKVIELMDKSLKLRITFKDGTDAYQYEFDFVPV